MGVTQMQVIYNDKTDLLYIRFDAGKHEVTNQRVADNIVLDVAENNRIIGIEIMDASKSVNLGQLLPIDYKAA